VGGVRHGCCDSLPSTSTLNASVNLESYPRFVTNDNEPALVCGFHLARSYACDAAKASPADGVGAEWAYGFCAGHFPGGRPNCGTRHGCEAA